MAAALGHFQGTRVSMKPFRTESSDDAALVREICTGNQEAFRDLYELYFDRLYRFIHRVTRQSESVEELVHETFLVVWEKPEGFDYTCKVSTWLFGIAYRKALKSLAKGARFQNSVDLEDVADFLACPQPSPAQALETSEWLQAALDSLPPEQRAVIELTFVDGLTYKEIAEVLECPENTVKTRVFHARKKLQNFASSKNGD